MEGAEQNINFLEIKAAILALKPFLGEGIQLPPHGVGHQQINNTTAVAYVNSRGHSVTPVPRDVPIGLGPVVFPADKRFMGKRPSLSRSVEC